jgi:hypothetical protein
MPRRKRLKWKGRNKKVETGAKTEKAKQELEGKLLSFFAIFFLYGFSSAWEEEDARRKRLKQ